MEDALCTQAKLTRALTPHMGPVIGYKVGVDEPAAGEPFNAVTITAAGVAPKLGVLGAAVPVEDGGRMARALGSMEVELRAADGEVLFKAPGRPAP